MSSTEKLQRTLGYTFSDSGLLTRALTHRSHGAHNNERLEFLGDSILNFVIAEVLFHQFEGATEGQLTRLRARMVKRLTLAEVSREFDLGDYLIMGTGELKSGGFERDSILADGLEAIVGAIYLDAGLDAVRTCIARWFESRLGSLSLKRSQKDSKSKLQELLQSRQADLPEYVVVDTSGKSHDRKFVVECRSPLLSAPTVGTGSSRRTAEQNAAEQALRQLGVEHDHDHT